MQSKGEGVAGELRRLSILGGIAKRREGEKPRNFHFESESGETKPREGGRRHICQRHFRLPQPSHSILKKEKEEKKEGLLNWASSLKGRLQRLF